ncbi:roadblock/LC7 domain-containing protein [candidate division KSB1 bacterium]|nr:roadblock/LC7 domain-containing protein [candidate division KSB1 bacterium]
MGTGAKDPRRILNLLLQLPGVSSVAIVGRDGFVIDSVSGDEVDLDALGAVISTGFSSKEVMGTELNLGFLTHAIMEYDVGKILTASCGEHILAVVTEPGAIIGHIRHNIKKHIIELGKLI